MIFVIGSIFFLIEFSILKSLCIETLIRCNRYTNEKETKLEKFAFKIWHLLLMILANLIPILNICVFCIFTVIIILKLFESLDCTYDYRFRFSSTSKMVKFLNKEL
jgi:hypothetical protein